MTLTLTASPIQRAHALAPSEIACAVGMSRNPLLRLSRFCAKVAAFGLGLSYLRLLHSCGLTA